MWPLTSFAFALVSNSPKGVSAPHSPFLVFVTWTTSSSHPRGKPLNREGGDQKKYKTCLRGTIFVIVSFELLKPNEGAL